MAGNILDMLSGLLGGGAAGMATIPGANSNKMLGALGLGSMGATTPDAPMDDMYGDIGEDIPEPKPRRARPIPRLGQPRQPQPYGGFGEQVPDDLYDNLEGLFSPDTPFGQNPFMEYGPSSPFLEGPQPSLEPTGPFGLGGYTDDTDQRNAIIQLLKLLGR